MLQHHQEKRLIMMGWMARQLMLNIKRSSKISGRQPYLRLHTISSRRWRNVLILGEFAHYNTCIQNVTCLVIQSRKYYILMNSGSFLPNRGEMHCKLISSNPLSIKSIY